MAILRENRVTVKWDFFVVLSCAGLATAFLSIVYLLKYLGEM